MNKEEFESVREKALSQLMTGKSLFGKDGALAPLLKDLLDAALDAEMDNHLDVGERRIGNKRNGYKTKKLKTSQGEIELSTPQDRQSSFTPELIKKRQTILADSLEPRILGMYGLGMSYQDIMKHIDDMYDMKLSTSVLKEITDRVLPKVTAWRNRPLEEVYPIVWLDAIHYKIREDHRVVSKALYNIMAINKQGCKEILGIYVSHSEGANFWLQVLTDLHERGVKDILICCTDNLKGFTEAIASVYPAAEVQKCIVHQVRNTLRYTASKDQKEMVKDMKKVYKSDTKELAQLSLEELCEKWQSKYPKVTESWTRNWDELSTFFRYTQPIRRLIYTTNPIEGYHRQIRKVTKTKGAFTSENALLKLIYLATKNIEKKWTNPVHNWSITVQQLAIHFEGRLKLDID
jgi:Transposase and inactivated derivatives